MMIDMYYGQFFRHYGNGETEGYISEECPPRCLECSSYRVTNDTTVEYIGEPPEGERDVVIFYCKEHSPFDESDDEQEQPPNA
jgi:hypothetical protein